MIIRVLIAVVLAVPAYFYTMRYNIHMFQQNGYKNKEHIHWLKKKFRLQWILYFGLALGIVTCVFPYLALEIFESLHAAVLAGHHMQVFRIQAADDAHDVQLAAV